MLPSWHIFQCESASDCFNSSDVLTVNLILYQPIKNINNNHCFFFFMKSIQPLIKALMQEETHTPGTTAHTDLRRHGIGVQTAFLHEGRKKVCDKSCYWVTGCNLFKTLLMCAVVNVRGKTHTQGKLVCDLTRTCLNMKWKHKLDSPLPPCFYYSESNVPLFRVAVEMEENPALQAPPWRWLMLQFAAQSFTYTDNLNNSWSRKGGGAQNRENHSFLKKWVSICGFFTTSEENFCSVLPVFF